MISKIYNYLGFSNTILMKIILSFLFLLTFHSAIASSVDTVIIRSEKMKKDLKCVVIKPNSYKKKHNIYPVVYLLHGYDGSYSNWIKRVPDLKKYADQYQILIVCPDGHKSSWYFDSPLDSSMYYETYIAREVPAFIEKHFKTIPARNARAITGLSMGGHGALSIAWNHAEYFGAVGSMSGVVDINIRRNSFDLAKRIGDTVLYKENWRNYSVINLIEKKPVDSLAIIIDCGVEDLFFNINRKLHEKLLLLKIMHDYSEKPGGHNWAYWSNAIQYHLLFFRNYFDKMKLPGKK